MRELQELDKNMDVRMEEDEESIDLIEGVRLEENNDNHNNSSSNNNGV